MSVWTVFINLFLESLWSILVVVQYWIYDIVVHSTDSSSNKGKRTIQNNAFSNLDNKYIQSWNLVPVSVGGSSSVSMGWEEAKKSMTVANTWGFSNCQSKSSSSCVEMRTIYSSISLVLVLFLKLYEGFAMSDVTTGYAILVHSIMCVGPYFKTYQHHTATFSYIRKGLQSQAVL